MNKILLAAPLALFTMAVYAQRKPTDPKHENHYMVQPVQTDELTINFKDAHSQTEFTQVNLSITNNTSDYIYFMGGETKFHYPFGDFSPKGSLFSKLNMTIEPKATESKTLRVSGDTRFHVDSLKVDLNGFYRVSASGKVIPAPDFQLPASKNSFKAGDCECTLEKSKQTTKETAAEFECKYTGNKVMFIDPSKLSVKLRDGQEFANNNKKDKGGVLMPGDDIKFTAVFNIPGKIADMQFTVLNINWNDTFTESTKVPMKVGTVDFVFDEGMTLLKNK